MNRILNQMLTIEKQVVSIFGKLVIGAAGAVTSFSGMGISGIVKGGTDGLYTITLEGALDKFLSLSGTMNSSAVGGSTAVYAEIPTAPASVQAGIKAKTLVIQFYDAAGAAVNPVSGSVYFFEIKGRRSSVGPA